MRIRCELSYESMANYLHLMSFLCMLKISQKWKGRKIQWLDSGRREQTGVLGVGGVHRCLVVEQSIWQAKNPQTPEHAPTHRVLNILTFSPHWQPKPVCLLLLPPDLTTWSSFAAKGDADCLKPPPETVVAALIYFNKSGRLSLVCFFASFCRHSEIFWWSPESRIFGTLFPL